MPEGTASRPRVLVSVLMPTWNRASFLRRALDSLFAQSYGAWELILLDDGSSDGTQEVVRPYLDDSRVEYHRFEKNIGLGAALNRGLELSDGPLIAYLPSDDIFYSEHLTTLVERLSDEPGAVLAYSGVRHHYNHTAHGPIDDGWLQLVQVMHRRTDERWIEREELVTDDLDRMFWGRLLLQGSKTATGLVTCEWVDHPGQLHKLLQEPVGGINLYRTIFQVPHPLRFHTSVGNRIDEVEQYRHFRERPSTPAAKDGLKILLVGELAYNADRVLALEEHGHRLFGLWMPDPYWYNTVGPTPFGHVTDVPRGNWVSALRRIKPDVIYALLNWQAVPFAHEVLCGNPGIPFVWHFKEGPFICLEKGTWPQLIDLYARADGRIYCSPEMRQWFETILPPDGRPTMVLDGDLPKADWFGDRQTTRLSESDGEIHTVVPGRPIGLHPQDIEVLARQKVHLHFYGDFTHGQWRPWIEKACRLADGYLHLHANVDHDRWVEEFSQYDAGWLHFFKSENRGDIRRANWDDLNYPARIATLAAAGLPLLQHDNRGSIVAMQTLARERGLGLFFDSMEDAADKLRERDVVQRVRENVWQQREHFTFDNHVDRLVALFRQLL